MLARTAVQTYCSCRVALGSDGIKEGYTEIMVAIWHAVVCIVVLTSQNVGKRFDICGGRRGVVMASRSAAFASKFIALCGKPIFVQYTLSNKVLIEGMDKYCALARLCYAFHENRTSHAESGQSYIRRLRNCMMKASIVAGRWNEHLLPNASMESLVNEVNKCVPDSLIPRDVNVLMGAIRHGRALL
ncbi:uncharacterized protein LOC135367551 [Ornithodoros turicata]|uniref:uncharacterized protein LOC135367551 n=1 Tax=Ornithodoros turicata TaxID=34597 RepID=UPI003138B889